MILGFSAALPYLLVAFMAILYGVTIVGDSASLTAGVVAAAPTGYRGTTLYKQGNILLWQKVFLYRIFCRYHRTAANKEPEGMIHWAHSMNLIHFINFT